MTDDLREIERSAGVAKAIMVVRLDGSGRPVEDGDQVEIGGNDKYLSFAGNIGGNAILSLRHDGTAEQDDNSVSQSDLFKGISPVAEIAFLLALPFCQMA